MPSENTIALVTGANKGIGYEIAAQLAELGTTVLLAARDPRRGAAAADTLRAAGGDVHPVTLDVTDPATVRAAATEIRERFGRLDVLVNNAGIPGAQAAPSAIDLEAARELFDTNYFGVQTVTNAVLPLLRRSAAPRIVNVSSGLGSLTDMTDPASPLAELFATLPPSGAYIPAKTALNSLTVQYAKELREAGFLVNAADPGPCDTDFNPGAPCTAAQGARVAVRLATLGPDGPTGGFFNDEGPVAW
ncbi:SDR family oxidoreductase [Amycolatopsis anabasis]|uniref:SDR family oxidoreductase n=1 Tax=Amycolatopsis anabasis TaxID=1840409 RepID=UPI00131E3998|nr:SDR family oxidoreductase [Amycolatopsis anabasis]